MTIHTTSSCPTWQEARRAAWNRDGNRRTLWYMSLALIVSASVLMIIGVPVQKLDIVIITALGSAVLAIFGLAEETYDLRQYHERMKTDAAFKKTLVQSWDKPSLVVRPLLWVGTTFLAVMMTVVVLNNKSWAGVLWDFAIGAVVLMVLRLVHKWDLHRGE